MRADVRLITLGVRDLDRSRRFYVEGLGWTPVMEVEGEVVFIQVGHGVLLGLFGAADLGTDSGAELAEVGPDRPAPMSLAHNVGSVEAVDAAYADALAAGAKAVKTPQAAAFGGYHAYVSDPDGFLWEIAHNAGLVVDADGTVRFS